MKVQVEHAHIIPASMLKGVQQDDAKHVPKHFRVTMTARELLRLIGAIAAADVSSIAFDAVEPGNYGHTPCRVVFTIE